jgi:hypothetical protein
MLRVLSRCKAISLQSDSYVRWHICKLTRFSHFAMYMYFKASYCTWQTFTTSSVTIKTTYINYSIVFLLVSSIQSSIRASPGREIPQWGFYNNFSSNGFLHKNFSSIGYRNTWIYNAKLHYNARMDKPDLWDSSTLLALLSINGTNPEWLCAAQLHFQNLCPWY